MNLRRQEHQELLNIIASNCEIPMNGIDLDQSIEFAELALQRSTDEYLRLKAFELKTSWLLITGRHQDALNTGLSCLKENGLELTERLPSPKIPKAPLSPKNQAIWSIKKMIGDAAFVADPSKLTPAQFSQIECHYKYGPGPLSSNALCSISLYYISTGDIETAYRLGRKAIEILSDSAPTTRTTVLNIYNGHLHHWKHPLKEIIKPLREAYRYGLRSGEYLFMSYAAVHSCDAMLITGSELDLIQNHCREYQKVFSALGNEYAICYSKITETLAARLAGMKTESASIEDLISANNYTAAWHKLTADTVAEYLLSPESEEVVKKAKSAAAYKEAAPGFFTIPVHNLYYSLALINQYQNAFSQDRENIFSVIKKNQKESKSWTDIAPMNKYKYELVEAEIARVTGDVAKANEFYMLAIEGASKQGYIPDKALVKTLAGEFYLKQSDDKGVINIRESASLYEKWGALAIVERLKTKHFRFLESEVELTQEFIKAIENNFWDNVSFNIKMLLKSLKVEVEYDSHSQKIYLIISRDTESIIRPLLTKIKKQVSFRISTKIIHN